ncbi:hypothetical protein CEXT_249911 [Caerostris extrusa]|uniref:Uncharacterized protein n=1 Tax=Caerostris extrusa TaxID=172846 RepID=A0AAV4WA54_CAEEX|nr:hypothetical protein CEXT_249911 [Caerostris extrusa]
MVLGRSPLKVDWDLWSPPHKAQRRPYHFDGNASRRCGSGWVGTCYFQDDNASCYVSTLTKAWYGTNGVHRMDQFAQISTLSRTSGTLFIAESGALPVQNW